MKKGDLVVVFDPRDGVNVGTGIYLGHGSRGTERKNDPMLYLFLWRGRITTFDKPYWDFKVIKNGWENSWKQ
jgi:hypothetical protein